MRMKTVLLPAFSTLLVIGLVGCQGLFGSDDENEPSLQQRIDDAEPGTTITMDGDHQGDLSIATSDVAIIGAPGTTISGRVSVTASDVLIDRVRIEDGIDTTGGGFENLTLDDVTLYGRDLSFSLSCAAIINPGETVPSQIEAAGLLEGRTVCLAPNRPLSAEEVYTIENSGGAAAYLETIGVMPPVGIANYPTPFDPEVTATKIYWTDKAAIKIQRANPDGTKVEDLFVGRPYYFVFRSDSGLGGIAVDTDSDRLYWTDRGNGKIQYGDRDGLSLDQDLLTSPAAPYGLAVDPVNDKLYWTNRGSGSGASIGPGKIQRSNLDGSNVEDLITGISGGLPTGIALDVSGGKLYWSDDFGGIHRADLDGSTQETLPIDSLNSSDIITDIALDLSNRKIYWSHMGAMSAIGRANLDGTGDDYLVVAGDLPTSAFFPLGIAVAPSESKLYWTSPNSVSRSQSKIYSAGLDGSNPVAVVSSVESPFGIAVETVVVP